MNRASDLRERLQFQQRALDANGDRRGAWEDAFDVAAELIWRTYRTGGEVVLSGRLQGQAPVIIKVWSSAVTRQIGAAWRAIDLRTGRIINIRSDYAESADRGMIEFDGVVDNQGGGS